MVEPSFSAVIPIIPRHHKYLPYLLCEFKKSIVQFNEILVIASSQTDFSISQLNSIKQKFSDFFLISVYSTKQYQTAGENRNLGFEMANSNFICFLDADDSYDNRRLSILSEIIIENNPDVILHDYHSFMPYKIMSTLPINRAEKTIYSKELRSSTFGVNIRDKKNELGIDGDTNILLPNDLKKYHRVHHAHITVRRSIKYRYTSMKKGEDGEYVRTCLENNLKVIYIPFKLSNYNRPILNNIFKSSLLKLYSKAARFKQNLLNSN